MRKDNGLKSAYLVGDDLALKDSALAILFSDFWIRYRLAGNSFRCHAKVRITAVLPDHTYTVQLLDCSPQEGRIQMPLGCYENVSLRQLHLSIALTCYKPPQSLDDDATPADKFASRRKPITEAELAKVEEIRKLHQQGITQTALCEQYGIGCAQMADIVHRRGRWRNM